MEFLRVVRVVFLCMGAASIGLSFAGALIMASNPIPSLDKYAKKIYRILFFGGLTLVAIAAALFILF